jgi:hypothetical protein
MRCIRSQGRKALARWKKHREKPVDPEILADLDSNPPSSEGDAIGSWRNFRTGKVMRWTVLRGDRYPVPLSGGGAKTGGFGMMSANLSFAQLA